METYTEKEWESWKALGRKNILIELLNDGLIDISTVICKTGMTADEIRVEQGEYRFLKLMNCLLTSGRVDDALLATTDEDAKKEFYREFGIR